MKWLISKNVATVTVLTTLLSVSACSSERDGDKPGAGAAEESACSEVLGVAGMDWLRDGAGAGKLRMKSDNDLKQAREIFYELQDWEPKDSADPFDSILFSGAYVCGVSKEGGGFGENFTVRYEHSVFPFDRISAGEGGTRTPVNSDVTLTLRKGDDGIPSYYVYFKCAIPGARKEQKERVPVLATMRDALTGDGRVRVHFQHLLHSAKVMAKSLDCQNKPVIPTEPPAAVK
ncbi:hypothetical protein J7I98_13860 [Streptomyces sp. ISL-98]|uniref:hypothetical protein n=1 Tax=Streptomyces sp. ISL-98 TaxID=2819192 RepID=UPI001BECD902|nr:hypothetical protein [Streptomyces sp. ISL-98]MBT2506956.1 hypothetical protein [Streptomyces sp. ISL-98]